MSVSERIDTDTKRRGGGTGAGQSRLIASARLSRCSTSDSVELYQDVRLRLLQKLPAGGYATRSPT